MKLTRTASCGALISLAAAGGLCYCAPAALCVISDLAQCLLGHGLASDYGPVSGYSERLGGYVGRLNCATVLALVFAVGLIVAIGALARANRSEGTSAVVCVLLLLGATAAVAAGLHILDLMGTEYVSFRTIKRGEGAATPEAARHWEPIIVAFRHSFLLLLGTPGALLVASVVGMRGRPRRAAPRRLAGAGAGLSVVAGLAFPAAWAANCISAHTFNSALAGHPSFLKAEDLGNYVLTTMHAQIAAGAALLFIGTVLGVTACLLAGRRGGEQQGPSQTSVICSASGAPP